MYNAGAVNVVIYYSEAFLKHETGTHPENKDRVIYARDYLLKTLGARVEWREPSRAGWEHIELVHTERYLTYLRSLNRTVPTALDPDTIFSPGSLDAALTAAGAVIDGVDRVVESENVTAFCLVRPPGHHALPDRAMGFCIFNNVAIGARYALDQRGLHRVAIIDIDVHHGNGTQEIFCEDADVLYASIHQYPFYPGTGRQEESGVDAGSGKTVNVPLPGGSGREEYLEALTKIILPAVEEHKPDLIMISAGFDAHHLDPIGGMALDEDAYYAISVEIKKSALAISRGRIVSVLEGGYHIDALARSIEAHLKALAD